jgi:hypothetical protein
MPVFQDVAIPICQTFCLRLEEVLRAGGDDGDIKKMFEVISDIPCKGN